MNGTKEIPITEIEGFRLGHAWDQEAATGCSVILCDHCSPAGVAVRGGGPASRETPLLDPLAASLGLHAILLSGGSAFGLDAAGGVMKYLEERDIGFDVGVTKVPLVCQSCVFDLVIGRKDVRPDSEMAYKACLDADSCKDSALLQGNVGVGMGCTVGKYKGAEYAMKGGLGIFALQAGNVKVGAIVAVNAMGDIYNIETGRQIAGLLNKEKNGFRCTEEEMVKDAAAIPDLFTGNTTIGVILTNGDFTKAQANKIAAMAHNGYARSIRPVHTTADGDTIYALSLGKEKADLNVVGTLAAYVMGMAVNRGVLAAQSAHGYLGAKDLL